jgi:hypothetical protein
MNILIKTDKTLNYYNKYLSYSLSVLSDNIYHYFKTFDLMTSLADNQLGNSCAKRMKTSESVVNIDSYDCCDKSLGDFSVLPNELILNILKHLSLEDLSLVSIVSKTFRDFIMEFMMKSKTGFDRLVLECNLNFDFKSYDQQQQHQRKHMFQTLGINLQTFLYFY